MKNNKRPAFRTMKKIKGNKGLLDKKRFGSLERDKKKWLRNLPRKKAIRLAEDMLSCPLVDEWLDNFPEDKPICLKMALKKKRKP
jgi:hypothetical protein